MHVYTHVGKGGSLFWLWLGKERKGIVQDESLGKIHFVPREYVVQE